MVRKIKPKKNESGNDNIDVDEILKDAVKNIGGNLLSTSEQKSLNTSSSPVHSMLQDVEEKLSSSTKEIKNKAPVADGEADTSDMDEDFLYIDDPDDPDDLSHLGDLEFSDDD